MIKKYTLLFSAILFTFSSFSQTYCSGTTSLTDAAGAFTDGSGSSNYADNSDCYWLIHPTGAGTITLRFTVVDLEPYLCSDKIRVYDGSDTLANQIAVVCNNTIPPAMNSSGGALLVRFTSDLSYNFAGWDANYTSTVAPPVYCSGTLTLLSPSGSFDDGSGISNYNDGTNCSWLIQPPNADSITLSFSALNTQAGHDFVKVYKGTSLSDPMVGSYSGSTLPQSLVISSGAMLINFTSDNAGNDLGWTASYNSTSASVVGISNYGLNKPFALFPNPFHQTATLQFSTPLSEECELQIADICGKIIKKRNIPSLASSLIIDMAPFPNGMYFYSISNKNNIIFTGKMIVQ